MYRERSISTYRIGGDVPLTNTLQDIFVISNLPVGYYVVNVNVTIQNLNNSTTDATYIVCQIFENTNAKYLTVEYSQGYDSSSIDYSHLNIAGAIIHMPTGGTLSVKMRAYHPETNHFIVLAQPDSTLTLESLGTYVGVTYGA